MVGAFVVVVLLGGCGRANFEIDADATPTDALVGGNPNVAFVTSTTQIPTTFGSDLAGADAICNARAASAGLPGMFVAYLSTTTVNGRQRLTGSRGWVRTDGKPLVDRVEDLVAGRLLHTLSFDEYGDDVGSMDVGTGTDALGVLAQNCSDFGDPQSTLTIGSTIGTTGIWTSWFDSGCSDDTRIYCFGIGRDEPLAYQPVVGRRAFLTVQPFIGGGLGVADQLCASEATAAGLTGTFVALLATTTASASSRFSMAGPTWVRLDGIALASSPLAFMTGALEAPLNLTIADSYVAGYPFTGAMTPIAIGTSASTCADWVDGTGTAVTIGYAHWIGPASFDAGTSNCDSHPIYCLEQ